MADDTRSDQVPPSVSGADIRTFLFADMRGYTRFTQEHGDDAASALAGRFADLVREAVPEFEGELVELRGDEALCVFRSARQALRASVELQRRLRTGTNEQPAFPLGVGMGLDAGEAVPTQGGYRGGALNLAARLCSLAEPGEVLASEAVVHLARRVDGARYFRGRIERLKGIDHPVRVVEVVPAHRGDALLRRLRRHAHGRRWLRLLAASGALVLVAAIVAVMVDARRGDHSSITRVGGNSLAEVDPSNGRVISQHPVGRTPTSVVAGNGAVWTLNADDQTISRLDLTDGEVLSTGLGVTPTDIALANGRLWVVYLRSDSSGGERSVSVLQLDPATMQRVAPVVDIRGTQSPGWNNPLIAAGPAGVWVAGPLGRVERLDTSTGRVATTIHLSSTAGPLNFSAIAVGRDEAWVSAENTLVGIDPASRKTRRIDVQAGGAIAVVGNEVWQVDSSGLVWRVDPGTGESHSVRVGVSASGIAYAGREVWVTSPVDGTLVGINPVTERVRRIPIGNTPQGVTLQGHHVWVSVAPGSGIPVAASSSDLGIATLPSSSCGDLYYGGHGRPQLMITSDFPLDPGDAPFTGAMSQAIEYTLRAHSFTAGRYRVAYQSCDDSTAQVGYWSEGKCTADAKAMSAVSSVVGVIGTETSGCAEIELPILNRARPGPLAMISPTNTVVGLTRSAPGATAEEPRKYYPTGIRNYARVVPADDVLVVADAILADRLGLRRVFVFQNGPGYPATLAPVFAAAARARGIEIIGPRAPQSNARGYRKLGESLLARHVDGIFIAGIGDDQSGAFVRGIRSAMGSSVTLIGTEDGPRLPGMYYSQAYIIDPAGQLPETGRRFLQQFSATQPRGGLDDGFAPYAAQAADVLLAAIARSDGSRASVARQLFRVRVRGGILGSFGFDRNGDITSSLVSIFHLTGDSESGRKAYALIKVIRQ